MKKGLFKWLAVMMMVILCVPQVFAASEIRVKVNGSQVYFPDGQPYIDSNSRVLVPVRFVSEQLGAKVNWDGTKQQVTVIEGNKTAVLTINSKKVTVNGASKELDTAAIIKGTRTYVPLRFVSEALGASVTWDSKTRIVYIDNGKAPLPEVKVFEAGPFTVPITSDCVVGERETGWTIRTENLVSVSHYDTEAEYGMLFTIMVAPQKTVAYDVQCEEAKGYLLQAFSEATANKVINYVKTKTKRTDKIVTKEYKESGYRIQVADNGNGVNIVIYTN